jgi:Bacterial Ig domain
MTLWRLVILAVWLVVLLASAARSDTLEVSWPPNTTDPDLAGYKVHWGTASRAYTAAVDAGLATSVTLTDVPDGQTIYVALTAYDLVGNESAYSAESFLVTPDHTAPTLAITAPANGQRLSRGRTYTIKASAKDPSGVGEVTFLVNGVILCVVPAEPYACAWSVPKLPNQRYVIRVEAVDTVGNHAAHEITVSTGA